MFARTNGCSQHARFNLKEVFAKGTFKNVYKGVYVSGSRVGEPCVAKTFKEGAPSQYEAFYFDEELDIIAATQQIIDAFWSAEVLDKPILLNSPDIWEDEETRRLYLCEPMIDNYEKFNSNSGWAKPGSDSMQALSHFSYHLTKGTLLLCDVQGGRYQDR